jgi:hypothetical protein
MEIPDKYMKDIKGTIPYNPVFRIHFDYEKDDPEENALRIPRDFKLNKLYFESEIDYKSDL